jgi:hypothetical protein
MIVVGCGRHDQGVTSEALTLPELNRVLMQMVMHGQSLPQDVNALTNSPLLMGKRLPVPPPGKKLVIDPTSRQAVFADQ